MKYIALIACLLAGCSGIVDGNQEEVQDAGSDMDTGSDSDGDTDTDSDTDMDADTDTDADSDTDTDGDGDSDTDADTNSDADTDDCEEVICDNPPKDECTPIGQLKEYDGEGVCVEAECYYTHSLTECEHGCTIEVIEEDHCADPCDLITCDDPPANECTNWVPIDEYFEVLKIYETEGYCEEGECFYNVTSEFCPDDNACIPEPQPYCMDLEEPAGWMAECQEEVHCPIAGAAYCLRSDEDETFGTCTTTGCDTSLDCYQGSICCDCRNTGKFDD